MESKNKTPKHFLINPAQIKRKPGDNCLCLKCAHSWFSKQHLFGTNQPQEVCQECKQNVVSGKKQYCEVCSRPASCSNCHRYNWLEPRVRAFKTKPQRFKKRSIRRQRK